MPAAPVAKLAPAISGRRGGCFGANGEILVTDSLPRPDQARASMIVFGTPGRLLFGLRWSFAPERGIVHRLFDLGVQDLDLGLITQARHHLLSLLLDELVHDRLFDLVEGGQRLVTLLLDLDDVPAELGLHRLGDLTDLERKGSVLERFEHASAAEEAEG